MSSNTKHKNFIGGAAVHKELQGFAAFVAYQNCHESGGSVTQAMLESSMGKQYFGDPKDPDSIGLAEQLIEGTGVFSSLYESGGSLGFSSPMQRLQVATSTNRATATTTAVIRNSTSILKPSLHCLGGHIAIPVGGVNGITLPLLLQSKLSAVSAKRNNNGSNAAQQEQDDYIKPRTLFTRAQEVAKNGKKALSCVMARDSPYKDYVKTGNLPSGMNHDDYLQFVREKMFVALNPQKQEQDADDLNHVASAAGTSPTTNSSSMEVVDADNGKMFTFVGYIVFALMGPIVENFDMLRYRSNLLMTSTPVYSSTAEKRLAGRNTSRSLKKAKVNDRKIAMHLKKVTGKQSMIQEQKFLISATAPDDPNRQLYLLELRKLQQDLASAIEDLTSAEEQIIEDEVADVAKLNNVDMMIENTLTSILDKNNNQERNNETRVSPMPPAFAGASSNDANNFDDEYEATTWNDI